MRLKQLLLWAFVLLFGLIAVLALYKRKVARPQKPKDVAVSKVIENRPIEIDWKALQKKSSEEVKPSKIAVAPAVVNRPEPKVKPSEDVATIKQEISQPDPIEIDQVNLLFQKNSPISIVQTIRYKSHVSWKVGKPAWLIDYASHYKTPIDFIARSINGSPDYNIRTVSNGLEFNVLAPNKDFYFYLVIDHSRCKMWFYYVEPEAEKSVLLKTYRVGLGRKDSQHQSGSLTPYGNYKLGKRVGVFKPKMIGLHKNKRVELVKVFGTRWIPFEKEMEGCTLPAKGLGIHGTPWSLIGEDQKIKDDDSSIGKFESDGCIRLKTSDIEELFSIISSRDTILTLVPEFAKAKLPYPIKPL